MKIRIKAKSNGANKSTSQGSLIETHDGLINRLVEKVISMSEAIIPDNLDAARRAKFANYVVYAERPDMEYTLYKELKQGGNFLRVYPDGKWELVASKMAGAEPIETGTLLDISKSTAADRFVSDVTQQLQNFIDREGNRISAWVEETGYGFWDPSTHLQSDMLKQELTKKFEAGWTVSDAYRFHSFSEEINPTLDEDKAVRNMDAIARKYKDLTEASRRGPAGWLDPAAAREREAALIASRADADAVSNAAHDEAIAAAFAAIDKGASAEEAEDVYHGTLFKIHLMGLTEAGLPRPPAPVPRWEHPFPGALYLGRFNDDNGEHPDGWFVPGGLRGMGSLALRYSNEPSDYQSMSLVGYLQAKNQGAGSMRVWDRLVWVFDPELAKSLVEAHQRTRGGMRDDPQFDVKHVMKEANESEWRPVPNLKAKAGAREDGLDFSISGLLNMTPWDYARAVNAEHPTGGFKLPEDEAYFVDRDIFTAYQYAKMLAMSEYSDLYKDVHGFRPRNLQAISALDLEELDQEIDKLWRQAEGEADRIDVASGGSGPEPLTYNPFASLGKK